MRAACLGICSVHWSEALLSPACSRKDCRCKVTAPTGGGGQPLTLNSAGGTHWHTLAHALAHTGTPTKLRIVLKPRSHIDVIGWGVQLQRRVVRKIKLERLLRSSVGTGKVEKLSVKLALEMRDVANKTCPKNR